MLYLVATPIGNLEDITFRAVRILKECDYVLAEDTRQTKKIFSHYKINNMLLSYNDANKKRKTPRVIQDLIKGLDIALVSDSGTPGISDPGFYLVRETISHNIKVSPVPGPSAVISAVVCSGLPIDKFTFYGFVPKKNNKRFALFNEIESRNQTSVFYESPHRILKTLKEISELLPNKQIVIAREMTKKYEEFIFGKGSEILDHVKNKTLKGELTLIIF